MIKIQDFIIQSFNNSFIKSNINFLFEIDKFSGVIIPNRHWKSALIDLYKKEIISSWLVFSLQYNIVWAVGKWFVNWWKAATHFLIKSCLYAIKL